MVALKPSSIANFLKDPPKEVSVILLYGPDSGLVAERGAILAGKLFPSADPFALAKYDGKFFTAFPERLLEETKVVSLFTDKRLIWIRHVGLLNLSLALRPVLKQEERNYRILIEAGDLKKSSPLRHLIEKDPHSTALPCYLDQERDLDVLIGAFLEETGQRMASEAKHALRGLLGGNRLASRQELEKLRLYTAGQEVITQEDVENSVGDTAHFMPERLVDAVAEGEITQWDKDLPHFFQSGHPSRLLSALLLQHFQRLHRLRSQSDAEGKSASAVVAQAKPPFYFARYPRIVRQLGLWTRPKLNTAFCHLSQASYLLCALPSVSPETHFGRLFLQLASLARKRI